ncbi:MAG: NAD(P)H-hydrate dehydratase, partial [Acidimicrobiales bacterium]
SDTPATVDPRRFAAAAVGPGLGRGDEASERLAWALELPLPLVIDADALTILGHDVSRRLDARPGPTVLTPHDGEYRALTGESPGADRIAAARDLAAVTGAVVLLKGGPTVVAAPDGRTRIVVSGDRRLAAAGTGDVLTGAICGQLAWQGSPPGPIHEVVAAAAHVHGRAAASGPDRGFVASDLLDLLAGAWC